MLPVKTQTTTIKPPGCWLLSFRRRRPLRQRYPSLTPVPRLGKRVLSPLPTRPRLCHRSTYLYHRAMETILRPQSRTRYGANEFEDHSQNSLNAEATLNATAGGRKTSRSPSPSIDSASPTALGVTRVSTQASLPESGSMTLTAELSSKSFLLACRNHRIRWPGMGSPGRNRWCGCPGVSRCQCGSRCHSGALGWYGWSSKVILTLSEGVQTHSGTGRRHSPRPWKCGYTADDHVR
jgi:hypothetical protein